MQRERPFSSAPLKAITGREGILDPVQCGYKVSGRTNTIAKAAHCVAARRRRPKKVAWELGMEKGREERMKRAKPTRAEDARPICLYSAETVVGRTRIACLRALAKSAYPTVPM